MILQVKLQVQLLKSYLDNIANEKRQLTNDKQKNRAIQHTGVSLPRHQANKVLRERRGYFDSDGTLWEECVHETCNTEEVYETVGGPRDWAFQYAVGFAF